MIDKLNDLFDNISVEDLNNLECADPKVKISRKSKKKILSLTQRKVDNKVRKISFKKPVAILLASIITVVGTVTAVAFHSNNKELVAKYLGESAAEKSIIDDKQKPIDSSENEHIKATANMVFNDANLFYIFVSFDGKDELGKKTLNCGSYCVDVYEDDEEHTPVSTGGSMESDKIPKEGKGDMMINILDTPSTENLILEFESEPCTLDESTTVKENVFEGIKLKISSKPNIKPAKFECKEGLVLELSKISMSIYVSDIDKSENSEEIRKAIDKIEDSHLLLPYECKLINKNGKESTFTKIDPQHYCTINGNNFFKCYSLDFLDLSDIDKIIINGIEFNKTK